MHLRDECDASYALARIIQARYFGPHSPCKMADFGVYLVPIWGGRILGPKSGYFQAVSGLFFVTLEFVISWRDSWKYSYVLARIIQARYFGPHSPCKMADFGVHSAPIWGGGIVGPKSGRLHAVSGLFLVIPDFVIFGVIFEIIPMICPRNLGPAISTPIHHVKWPILGCI